MDDEPQLRLIEIFALTSESLVCTVRCVAGTVRLGETLELRTAAGQHIAEGLTISVIEYVGDVLMDFIDLGRTALVTVTGSIDEAALRAVVPGDAPEHVVPANVRLVVR